MVAVEPHLAILLEELADGAYAPSAARALGQIGAASAAPQLRRALVSGDRDLREQAAGALGAIGVGDRATHALLHQATSDPERRVCRAAQRALALDTSSSRRSAVGDQPPDQPNRRGG